MTCTGCRNQTKELHADMPLCAGCRGLVNLGSEGSPVVALVGCGAQKRSTVSPARELYTGPLFRGCLQEGLARAGDQRTVILSAKHGMLLLDAVVAPYDVYLPRLPRVERAAWGERTAAALVKQFGDRVEAHVFAGAPYLNALRPFLPPTWIVANPLKGLTQGARLAWLKRQREARAGQ